jgi:hypothetical protein
VHDVFGYWTHDFAMAQNPSFATLVAKNGGRTTSNATAGSKLRKTRMTYEE